MSRRLNIEIETAEQFLWHAMFETLEFSAGETQLTLPDGSIAVWSSAGGQKSFGAPEIIGVGISLAASVGPNLVSNWLHDKIEGSAR